MAKLIDFPVGLHEGETRLDLDPDAVLTGAVGRLKDVVIVGYEANGDFYFASSQADGPDYFWRPLATCPRSVKVQLLGEGGVAVYGMYDGQDNFWKFWAPLPKINKQNDN